MDIEKLIERLSKYSEPVIAYKLDADFAASITDAISELRCKCDGCSVPATTAEMIRDLNDAPKLRAENEKLRDELEQERAHRIHAEQHADAFLRDCERLNAQLERVTAERDEAVEDLLDAAITPCSYCKRNPSNGGTCDMDNDSHEMFSCWQWRGIEED